MNTMKEELGNKDTLRLISQAAEAREACLKYLSLFEELANINGELKDPIFLKLNLSSPLQEMLKNASVIKKASQKVEDVYLEMQNEIRRIAYLRYKKEWLEKQGADINLYYEDPYARANVELFFYSHYTVPLDALDVRSARKAAKRFAAGC